MKSAVHLQSVFLSNNVQEEMGCLSVVYLQVCLTGTVPEVLTRC